ncbi:MAG TPA: WhiB family transcriptional regulator [Candidatus Saccharimonadales bacterium]
MSDKNSWRSRAKCRGYDPDFFHPEEGGDVDGNKKFCFGCPVIDECLEYALEHREQRGIWGGTSERQRRRIATQRRTQRDK